MIVSGQPGHIDQIKQMNAGGVYRLIDEHGPISRIELSKQAQLAPASITKIVRELMEAHLVRETEYQEMGSRGRPAIGLVLDTEAWHYLSVRISNQVMTLALRDLSGHLVVEDKVDLPSEHPQPLLERILTDIDQFFYPPPTSVGTTDRYRHHLTRYGGLIHRHHSPYAVLRRRRNGDWSGAGKAHRGTSLSAT
ncbi:hypothetical protein DZS_24190 [Dickeya ananatis]